MNLSRILAVTLCGAGLALADSPAVWLDVPFVRQEAHGCGSAALAMIQDYWNQQGAASISKAEPHAIQEQLYVPSEKGIPARSMTAYLEQVGFQAFAFPGTWADLQQHISRGRPLIVALRSGKNTLHYAVVVGVGEDEITLNDPADRKLRKHSRAEFERDWSATDQWTLLAVPASR